MPWTRSLQPHQRSRITITALVTFITVRYGALAAGMMQGSFFALFTAPDLLGAGWATALAPVALAALIATAVWAFRVALGGQSPFSASLLDE